MSGQSDPYVRVYYSIIGDDKFASIYNDDAALAAWLRLLLIADAMYPAPASLPRTIRPKALAALSEAGLIDLMPSDHYRIHGLESERTKRADSARASAEARWSKRNANALRPHTDIPMRSHLDIQMRTDASRAEPSRAEPRENERLNNNGTSVGASAAVESSRKVS